MKKYVTILVYIPEYYNSDKEGKRRKVEEDKFIKTAEEITMNLSGGGTWHANKTGIWLDDGEMYYDELRIFEFDLEDKEANRHLVIKYVKETLLNRFEQIAIYVKFIPYVEPVIVRVE